MRGLEDTWCLNMQLSTLSVQRREEPGADAVDPVAYTDKSRSNFLTCIHKTNHAISGATKFTW